MSGGAVARGRRALVTGAGGLLGSALCRRLPDLGYDVVAAADHAACDICDVRSVHKLVAATRPDVLFNAAGFTNVDAAERAPDEAWRTNALGPEVLAKVAAEHGAALVHYSTDFVFDGEQERWYDELDTPAPAGTYARSKLAGERLAAAAWKRVFVLRVGCLFGHGGRNFPSTLLGRLRAGQRIAADDERMASPTWVDDVVRVSAELARTDHPGLYHCTANGETTWAGFARFLAAQIGAPEHLIDALPSNSISVVVPRPRRAILLNRMLRLRELDIMPRWDDGVRAYLRAEQSC